MRTIKCGSPSLSSEAQLDLQHSSLRQPSFALYKGNLTDLKTIMVSSEERQSRVIRKWPLWSADIDLVSINSSSYRSGLCSSSADRSSAIDCLPVLASLHTLAIQHHFWESFAMTVPALLVRVYKLWSHTSFCINARALNLATANTQQHFLS